MGNTLKFAKDGTVLVNAKNDRKGNEVVVSVKDTGQGLDPEVLPRLFSKFASKSFQGTDWVYLSPKALSKLMVARCGLTIMLMVEALLSFLVCL